MSIFSRKQPPFLRILITTANTYDKYYKRKYKRAARDEKEIEGKNGDAEGQPFASCLKKAAVRQKETSYFAIFYDMLGLIKMFHFRFADSSAGIVYKSGSLGPG